MGKGKKPVEDKLIESKIHKESTFICNLFQSLAIPDSARKTDSDNEEGIAEDADMTAPEIVNKTERVTSLQELQKRFENIKKTKRKLSYKDKLLKKGIKNRLKKKSKRDQKNAEQKLKRAEKLTNGHVEEDKAIDDNEVTKEKQQSKPVFNKDDKIVYSKIDFSNLGQKKEKKRKRDPKQLLEDLQKQKAKVQKLESEGLVDKAIEIKEKAAWKNAIAKAQGEKVKDDETLLKKTVKRQEQQVRSSKKKWQTRIANVEKGKEERQKKRQENIDKRKKEKKVKKMKKAVKKGKIIPGF